MRTLFVPLAPLVFSLACAGSPAPSPDAPGPKRPHTPDHELDAAPPHDISDEAATRAWLTARVAAANGGHRERARLPLVRRAAAFGCDCPEFAIAPAPDSGPFYWVAIEDQTSAGIPPGDWTGWVDGHFTGALRTYPAPDGGSATEAPVFKVFRQSRRAPDAIPEARVVPDKN